MAAGSVDDLVDVQSDLLRNCAPSAAAAAFANSMRVRCGPANRGAERILFRPHEQTP